MPAIHNSGGGAKLQDLTTKKNVTVKKTKHAAER